MKIAFVLFRYFPFGGLQRDMLAIAHACIARGNEVTIITREWQGERDAQIPVEEIPVSAFTNHARDRQFAVQINRSLRERFDLVVGFNKMPNLDVYYAADSCFAAKVYAERSFWYRFMPRARAYLALERGVFGIGRPTHALMISAQETAVYQHYYQTAQSRLHQLPPGIRRDRIRPDNAADIASAQRQTFNIASDETVLLFVGSGFRTKGLDRAIIALANLPEAKKTKTRLWIIGQDKPDYFQALAKKYRIDDRVIFLGGRDDVPQWLWTADALIHPAYRENTGTVLLEAMVAGCPVLTTSACGYAHYVTDAGMGEVIEQSAQQPFDQAYFNLALNRMLSSMQSRPWLQRAKAFAETTDIYDLPQRAAQIIERIGARSS
jgi:UDP-glucose:(heptosyl)LPS alpha-1,3-glucosyltransferase